MKLLKTLLIASLTVLLVPVLPALAKDGAGVSGKLTAKKAKYLRNAVVYLEGVTTPAPKKPRKMDQINQKFKPHVLPVVKGTKVRFLNNDNTGHNVYTPDGEKYDLGTWPKGEERTYTFDTLGTYTQLCKMHPQMLAYVVVLPNGYFAKSKKDGSFAIKNVPPGKYTLKVWHPKRKAAPQSVTVGADGIVDLELALTR